MANGYPCPNPACTQVFDPAQIAGVPAITCPRCGMTFQLRAGPTARPATAPPTVPRATPIQPKVPVARPIAPAPPRRADPPPVPSATIADNAPIVVARKMRRGGGREWLTYLLAFGAFLGLVGIGIAVAVVYAQRGLKFTEPEPFRSPNYNYTLKSPGKPWDQDTTLGGPPLAMLLAFRRSDPNAWFAIGANDYKDRNPSPRELEAEVRGRLDKYVQNLETSPPRGGELPDGEPVAGQPTKRIVFEGKANDADIRGEALMFSYKGIGYWIFCWAPAADEPGLQGEFADLKKKFGLLEGRDKWKQDDTRRQTFTVEGLTLTDAEGLWKQESDPTDHDEKAVLVLRAWDRAAPRDVTRMVEIQVLKLPAGGDPAAAATTYLLAKHKKVYEETVIEEAAGTVDKVGAMPGKLFKWRVQNAPSRLMFAVVGVVPRPGEVVVLYAECTQPRRTAWEGAIQQLFDTLKAAE